MKIHAGIECLAKFVCRDTWGAWLIFFAQWVRPKNERAIANAKLSPKAKYVKKKRTDTSWRQYLS